MGDFLSNRRVNWEPPPSSSASTGVCYISLSLVSTDIFMLRHISL